MDISERVSWSVVALAAACGVGALVVPAIGDFFIGLIKGLLWQAVVYGAIGAAIWALYWCGKTWLNAQAEAIQWKEETTEGIRSNADQIGWHTSELRDLKYEFDDVLNRISALEKTLQKLAPAGADAREALDSVVKQFELKR